jgi:hypothetical protein
MAHVEALDFDALVRKHVRIVPTYRSFQISSWVLLSVALILPIIFALTVGFDVLVFGFHIVGSSLVPMQEVPTLDFQFSRTFIHDQLFGEWLTNWWSLTGMAFAWPLAFFLTLSLISLQFDWFVLAALSLVFLWQTARAYHRCCE